MLIKFVEHEQLTSLLKLCTTISQSDSGKILAYVSVLEAY